MRRALVRPGGGLGELYSLDEGESSARWDESGRSSSASFSGDAAWGAAPETGLVSNARRHEKGSLSARQQTFYIQEMQLHPLRVNVTVQMDIACDEPALQVYHPTNAVPGIARHFISLHNVTIVFDCFTLDEVFESGDRLLHRILRSYAMQGVTQIYKLIGSLDLLGNPSAVFADVGGGVRTFFDTQWKGEPRAHAEITVSFVSRRGVLMTAGTFPQGSTCSSRTRAPSRARSRRAPCWRPARSRAAPPPVSWA